MQAQLGSLGSQGGPGPRAACAREPVPYIVASAGGLLGACEASAASPGPVPSLQHRGGLPGASAPEEEPDHILPALHHTLSNNSSNIVQVFLLQPWFHGGFCNSLFLPVCVPNLGAVICSLTSHFLHVYKEVLISQFVQI